MWFGSHLGRSLRSVQSHLQERGYRAKDIPGLILQKNLFGLEIDDRAAQLAAFALMMKARADDRRIFESEAKPNVVAFVDSKGMDADEIAFALNSPLPNEKQVSLPVPDGLLFETDDNLFTLAAEAQAANQTTYDTLSAAIPKEYVATLIALFENAKTFGSLIQVPLKLASKLPKFEKRLADVLKNGDLTHSSARILEPLMIQAGLLARQYNSVVANPPYMGGKYMTSLLKDFMSTNYSGYHSDLYSSFIVRNMALTLPNGGLGFMSPFTWMFISSHTELRNRLIDKATLATLVQLEYSGFAEATVPICTFTVLNHHISRYVGSYIRLSSFRGPDRQAEKTLEAIQRPDCGWMYRTRPDDFKKVQDVPFRIGSAMKCVVYLSKVFLLATLQILQAE